MKNIFKVDLSSKVLVLPNICGIEIDLSGSAIPSINPSLQPFYNTYVQNSEAVPVYFTPSKASVSESGEDSRAGMVFTQTLSLRFPSNDPLRAQRISNYLKVKYIYIKLSTGLVFFFGRNDIAQNSNPKVKFSSNEKTSQITYTCKSMSSMGFTNGSWEFQLPADFPINFYNL